MQKETASNVGRRLILFRTAPQRYFGLLSVSAFFSQVHSFKQPHGLATATVTALAAALSASASPAQQAPAAQHSPVDPEQQAPASVLTSVVFVAQHSPLAPAQQVPLLVEDVATVSLQQLSSDSETSPRFRQAVLTATSALQQLELLVATSLDFEQQSQLATAATGVFSVAAPELLAVERLYINAPIATKAATVIIPNSALCIMASFFQYS